MKTIKKWIGTAILINVIATLSIFGQAAPTKTANPTALPNISVIGTMLATSDKNESDFQVKELEFAFQSHLYPSVKVDIFAALHTEDSGETEFELEEAYLTLLDFTDTLFKYPLGIGLKTGKKLISFGKLNTLHSESWVANHRAIAHQALLGGEEGLAANGGEFSYIIPTPFFLQVEAGAWTVKKAEEEEEAGSIERVEYTKPIYSARLWSSFELSKTAELQLGTSAIVSNADSSFEKGKVNTYGLDVTYSKEFGKSSLNWVTELIQSEFQNEAASKKDTQLGGYSTLAYKVNKFWSFATQYDYLEKNTSAGEDTHLYSLIATKQLTETSKFKLQVRTGDKNIDSQVSLKIIFGIGPHSHVLQ